MSDGERRLEAAAHAVAREIAHSARESDFYEDSLVPCVNTYYDAEIIAKAAIDAYNRPLEPVVLELVTQMERAIRNASAGAGWASRARAALRVVVRRLHDHPSGWPALTEPEIALMLHLSEQYVRELLDE